MPWRTRQIALYGALLAGGVAVIAFVLLGHLKNFWGSDRCLDAGGAWLGDPPRCDTGSTR
ncbi:hypothetical protein [Chitinolyticbacter albus]|uniref:hypothetical protein n=1 Tax=Chitinolyticbacter albus TaxID=2961951 RepID=UPI00210E5FB1|nr:hypothetical protein [Chitinolyticbacter albus]